MNRRGFSLVQMILGLTVGTGLLSALVPIAQTLTEGGRQEWREYDGVRYAVVPAMSEGVRAAEFHFRFSRLREDADLLLVFGGEIHYSVENGNWWLESAFPLREDTDWNSFQSALQQETETAWLRRLAYQGTNHFFSEPIIGGELTEESSTMPGDFTLVLLRGQTIMAVVQSRQLEPDSHPGWTYWRCDLKIGPGFTETLAYEVAWRREEYPRSPKGTVWSPSDGEASRFPGLRQYCLSSGAPQGTHWVFAEIGFPDPWQKRNERQRREGALPPPRYFYLSFIR